MRVLYIEPDSEWQELVRGVIEDVYPDAEVVCVNHPDLAEFRPEAMPDIVIIAGFMRNPTVVLQNALHMLRLRTADTACRIIVISAHYAEHQVQEWGADRLCDRSDVDQNLPALLRDT